MEVLLKNDVEHLGKVGDLVEVKAGYGRNFLLPRGKAIRVTKGNALSIEKEREKHRVKEAKRVDELKTYSKKLEEVNCTVLAKADDSDKLYGSVTTAEIAKSLKIAGYDINPKLIEIPTPIKTIGVHEVLVKFEAEILSKIKVWAVRD